MEPFNKVLRMLIEQNLDPVLLIFKKKQKLELPSEEQKLTTNPRYTHYCQDKKPIIVKDYTLDRHYYNDVVNNTHLKVLLAVQLSDTLLKSLHGEANKHPGVSKMMQENRQNTIHHRSQTTSTNG